MALFERTYIKTELVPYEKRVVHEGVGPDKATDILQGFEKKALENLVGEFRLESNAFKGSVIIIESVATLDREAAVIFELNGKKHDVRVALPRYPELDGTAAVRLLVEKMSNAMTAELLRSASNEVAKFIGRRNGGNGHA